MVTPRSRNSVDFAEGPKHNDGLGGTTWAWCQNVTGDKCNNGQTAYWYSQGCASLPPAERARAADLTSVALARLHRLPGV